MLGAARILRQAVVNLQRWRGQAAALCNQTDRGQVGLSLMAESIEWERRMAAASATLVDFATELDRLSGNAADLIRLAGSYRNELQSLQIAEWYEVRLGVGTSLDSRQDARSLELRLAAVQLQADQLRIEFASWEGRLGARIGELASCWPANGQPLDGH